MKNPIQAMFEAGVVEATDFPPESRYHGLPTKTFTFPDGRQVPYLPRRFVPPESAFATQGYRRTKQGERLDNITAATLGDPTAFWRLCDSNGAIWAEELEETGFELRLTLPEGVPGPQEDDA